jgi:hypothetical protein
LQLKEGFYAENQPHDKREEVELVRKGEDTDDSAAF